MRIELQLFQKLKEKVQSFSTLLRLDTFVKKLGRKLAVSIEDILAIALFKQESQITTKKKCYELLELQSHCSYKTLVVNMNRWHHLAIMILALILKMNRISSHPIKHTDSTDIPVCLNKNARHHKTIKDLASWSHNGKGYYYGLKLHLTTNLERKMLAIKITSACVDEREIFIPLNNELSGLFVADAGYISEKLEKEFYKEGIRRVLIKPRKNMKKLATLIDILIYNTRMLIELNFRNLKMFFGLITSLPRSVDGYLANSIYSLLAYAIA